MFDFKVIVDVPIQPRTRHKRTAPSPKCIAPPHSLSTPTHLQPSRIPRHRRPSPRSSPPCRNRTLHAKECKSNYHREIQSPMFRQRYMRANVVEERTRLNHEKERARSCNRPQTTQNKNYQLLRRVLFCLKPIKSTVFLTCRACCAT